MIASDFITSEPDNRKPGNNDKKTEIKVLYDNEPDKIQKEITKRDVFLVSNHFSVSINGLNDSQNDFRFLVSVAGVQMDCLATGIMKILLGIPFGTVKLRSPNFGWVAELKIP